MIEDGCATETAICCSWRRSGTHQRVLPQILGDDVVSVVERLRLFKNG